jgi:hypothetical protein
LLPCKCFRRYMASLNLLCLSPSFGLSWAVRNKQ